MAHTLNYYKSRQRYISAQISSRKAKNAKIQRDIRELESAYEQLGKIKRSNLQNAQTVRDQAKLSKVAGDVEWRGNYKKQFDSIMNDRVSRAARDFYNSIDAMQDEVGRALDRKRGEYDSGSLILNGLNKTLNNITGIIRNWVN